jgi:hypothetical protein
MSRRVLLNLPQQKAKLWHTGELPQEHTGGSLACNFGDLAVIQGDCD